METPQLQVSDLYQRRQSKDTARLKAYNQILESIYHRIRTQSKLPNSPCSLLYTIPPFILGLPRIDLEDCVVYLVYQLRNSGFLVKYTYQNLVGISWAHHERDYILEQSPIMRAMMDSRPKEKDKPALFTRKPRAKANKHPTPANVVISPYAYDKPNMGAGKAPSASDYQPPTIFVETMKAPDPRPKGVLSDLWA